MKRWTLGGTDRRMVVGEYQRWNVLVQLRLLVKEGSQGRNLVVEHSASTE